MPGPWNNWWHAMGNTYGTWLPGDARGWRSRHHREHVEGDYRHPPTPGTGREAHVRALARMNRAPVLFGSAQREIAVSTLVEKLRERRVEVVDAVVTARHFHMLVRFRPLGQSPGTTIPGLNAANALCDGRDPLPRHLLGLAKKHASHMLRAAGMSAPGGIWAVRTKLKPIANREHQLAVVAYIRSHAAQGGAVWSQLAHGETSS